MTLFQQGAEPAVIARITNVCYGTVINDLRAVLGDQWGKTRPRIPTATIKRLKAVSTMRAAGATVKDIAEQLRYSETTIRDDLTRLNAPTASEKVHTRRRTVAAKTRSGATVKAIAESLGVPEHTIRKDLSVQQEQATEAR